MKVEEIDALIEWADDELAKARHRLTKEAPSFVSSAQEDYRNKWSNTAAALRLARVAPQLAEALDQVLDDMGEDGLSCCQAAKEQAASAIAAFREAGGEL